MCKMNLAVNLTSVSGLKVIEITLIILIDQPPLIFYKQLFDSFV